MHLETLIYITLQAAPQLQPIKHWRAPDFASLSRSWDSHVQPQSLVSYGTTTIAIGHDDDDRLDPSTAYDPAHEYGWDVESPRREVAVEGFKISALPISNEDFRLHLIAHPEEKDLFPMAWSRSKQGSLEREDLKVKTIHGEVPFEYCRLWAVTGSAEQLLSFATVRIVSLTLEFD
jgi:formylglycine-generating enzyme required for sulfatase activity